jgi:hypothetical protein
MANADADGLRGKLITPPKERATIDKSQSLGTRTDAAMTATVDFKNAPSWVKTAVDDNGKFKKLNIRRSTPPDGRAGSGLGDYNPWASE